MQPQATEATDEDCLELMEMILGALGRDAIGLGARWVRLPAPTHICTHMFTHLESLHPHTPCILMDGCDHCT